MSSDAADGEFPVNVVLEGMFRANPEERQVNYRLDSPIYNANSILHIKLSNTQDQLRMMLGALSLNDESSSSEKIEVFIDLSALYNVKYVILTGPPSIAATTVLSSNCEKFGVRGGVVARICGCIVVSAKNSVDIGIDWQNRGILNLNGVGAVENNSHGIWRFVENGRVIA